MNPSIGPGGTMAPMPTSSFDMSHAPQPTFTVGGWNLPTYGSSPSYALSGANTQMGAYSTYYTPSMYPSSTMSVPSNTFPMVGPHVSPGISYRENQFYGSGYPLHGTPSHGGNIYPHLNSPYHTSVSSQTSVMMPIQTYLDQLGGGYYLSRQGQGVNHDPSWPAMFQSQSFPGPWYQMPQLTASSVTASHTGAPSPTSASHVGDGSTTSISHVETHTQSIASHVGGITLVSTSHINVTSPTSVHHVGDDSLASASHVESMSPAIGNDVGASRSLDVSDVSLNSFAGLAKDITLLVYVQLLTGIPEAWFSPEGPLGSEVSVVSPHPVSPLIDMTVMPLQSSPDHTPIVEGDVSPIPVIMHPLQPMN
jgi:hypothetical protein